MSRYVSWSEVRARTPHDKAEVEKLTKKYLAKSRLATLTEIRVALGFTQQDIANIVGIDQSNVSRIEKGRFNKSEIRTLYSYIEALGGELEIRARFGENSLQLVDSSYEERLSNKKTRNRKSRRN